MISSVCEPHGTARLACAFACSLMVSAPMSAAAVSVTTVELWEIDPGQAPTESAAPSDFFTIEAPYNLAGVYSAGASDRLLLVGGVSGEARVINLSAGQTPSTVQELALPPLGFRAMDIVSAQGTTYIYLLSPHDGVVYRYQTNAEGLIELNPTVGTVDQLVDKTLFDAVPIAGGMPTLTGLDGFYGSGALVDGESFGFQKLFGAGATDVGYTELDHVAFNGQRYRMLYRSVGDPYLPGAPSPDAGRRVVSLVNPDGTSNVPTINDLLAPGYTTVRFYRRSDAILGMLAYDRRTGYLRTSWLNSVDTESGPTNTTWKTGFDEVLSYRRAAQTYLVGIRYTTTPESVKLDGAPAARFAQCIHDNLATRAVGYQLSLIQNGSVLVNRAHGYRKLFPQRALLRSTRIDMGSVGKLFTTVTALALPAIELADPIIEYLDPNKYSDPDKTLDPWVSQRSVQDLMAHTTGQDVESEANDCDAMGEEGSGMVDCTQFFQYPANESICGGGQGPLSCQRVYNNANLGALRQVIEGVSGVTTSSEIDALARSLWLATIVPVGGPTCLNTGGSAYFNACTAADSCGFDLGEHWSHGQASGWSPSCGAGGWEASARDMTRILEALAGSSVLPADRATALFDTTLVDSAGRSTARGWEPPYQASPSGPLVLGKDGALVTQAYVTYLDGFADAALHINTRVGPPNVVTLLRMAYKYAIAPMTNPCQALPTFPKLDTAALGASSDVAIEMLQPGGSFVVARVTADEGLLEVTRYSHGGVDIFDHGTYTGSSPSIHVLRLVRIGPKAFVVAYLDEYERLVLQLYGTDGWAPNVMDQYTMDSVYDVALAPTGVDGAELAVVTRTKANKLRVTAFAVGLGLTERKSYVSSGNVWEVAAERGLGAGSVMTAVLTQAGYIKPIAFSFGADGSVEREGEPPASALPLAAGSLRLARIEAAGKVYYATAARSAQGNLAVGTWTATADLQAINALGLQAWGSIDGIAEQMVAAPSPYLFVPVELPSGDARTKVIQISPDGLTLTAVGDFDVPASSPVDVLHFHDAVDGDKDYAVVAYLGADANAKLENYRVWFP